MSDLQPTKNETSQDKSAVTVINQPPAAVSSCCSPVKQESCCEPSEKTSCCGAESESQSGGCGCQ